ncbi:MAG: NAD-dependent epimerase/dehydratase family protein [Thermoplasmataceae archaeon]|jgi:nucleoside-diphosphate-sugar epimerase
MGTILVTGAYGQVGRELIPELEKRYGTENVIISDVIPTPPDLKRFRNSIIDVSNADSIIRAIDDFHVESVFHLAAILSATGEKNPQKAFQINLLGTYNILEAGLKRKLSKIMIPSTIGVFGNETPKKDVPVDTVTKPRTMYGVTKVATEILGNYYFYRFGLDVRGLRYPGLISYSAMPGGGTTDYSVEMFHYAIANKKYTCFLKDDTMLPMMYMPDAINAFLQLYEADVSVLSHHTDYNISAFSFTPKDLENAIKKRIPDFSVEYVPDFRQSIADSWPETIDHSEASRDWGFKFSYDFERMVDDMITNLRKPKKIEIGKQA